MTSHRLTLHPSEVDVVTDSVTGEVLGYVWSAASSERTEHGILMPSGGVHVRNGDAEFEEIYPLDRWIVNQQRFGGKVLRRRIIVVEDWTEVPS